MVKKKYSHLNNIIKYHLLWVIYLYLNLTWINKVFSKKINVSNENEFKNAFNSNNSEIVLLSSFSLNKKYILNSLLTNNIKISGQTNNITLNFDNEQNGFIFNSIENIEINNLKFIGNINFENCKKVTIKSVEFNGLINGNNSDISFYKIKYYNTQNIISMYGIYLNNAHLKINESSFYGSKPISNYIIFSTNETGINVNINNTSSEMTINNSYFSGEYISGIIKVNVQSIINIQKSDFVNGYSTDNGSILNVINSSILINNCTIMNNYSDKSGGSFYLEDNHSFTISNSLISNSTADLDGGAFYILDGTRHVDIPPEDYNHKLINITVNNMSNMYSYSEFGENYRCGKKVTCAVLAAANSSQLYVEDFNLNDAYVYSKEGFIIYLYEYSNNFDENSLNNNQGLKGVVFGMKLTNIIQMSDRISSLFWVMDSGYLSLNK
ncbi:hypothetical protein PIROE2DRAFT_20622 [Piromyces sp. E2]|nr:hypothetical protein PIROE2DRAFT_20622 [Piromyces sp. E2]|eukprot:OUM63842.1 hypothetical protein PIROE2DRAFT_20622 [Piromyces sp. E2]